MAATHGSIKRVCVMALGLRKWCTEKVNSCATAAEDMHIPKAAPTILTRSDLNEDMRFSLLLRGTHGFSP
jgi:hypothetical protein